jgi:hypothetical protein
MEVLRRGDGRKGWIGWMESELSAFSFDTPFVDIVWLTTHQVKDFIGRNKYDSRSPS